ncbi:MAG: hypothetical protein VXZ35_02545, partial [Pseudomonadota bacterium]|nr:hypothetical protein [Pseudomonadota bacterium]
MIAAGYDPESNSDDRITCTVINVVLITLFAISLAWIFIAFFILDLFQAVMFNALLAMSALILHIGMHMKKVRAIRLLLSGVLVTTSFSLNLMFGKQGAEPYAIIMLMTILVIHPNLKEPGALITVFACGALLSASTIYAYFHNPIIPTTDEIKSIGYLSTVLTTIAGAVTLMLA